MLSAYNFQESGSWMETAHRIDKKYNPQHSVKKERKKMSKEIKYKAQGMFIKSKYFLTFALTFTPG